MEFHDNLSPISLRMPQKIVSLVESGEVGFGSILMPGEHLHYMLLVIFYCHTLSTLPAANLKHIS